LLKVVTGIRRSHSETFVEQTDLRPLKMKMKRVPSWLSAPLVLGAFVGLVWLDRRRRLRGEVEPKTTRAVRNLAVAGLGAAALQLTENPIARSLSALAERRKLGLLKLLRLPVGWRQRWR